MLTACSGGDDEAGKSSGQSGVFDSVSLTEKDDATAPEVTFDTPLEITETSAKVIKNGDGDTVSEGQSVGFKFVAVNAEDGSVLGDTYGSAESYLAVNDQLKQADPQLFEVLEGAKVGAQIAYSYLEPVAEGETAEPARVMILKILSTQNTVSPLTSEEAAALDAEGNLLLSAEDTAALDAAGELPTVTFGEDGAPAVEIPDSVKEPEKLIVKVLEEGDGAVTDTSSTVVTDYLGVSLRDGSTFDSSYERGEALEFPLNGVISGWTYGLAGQKAGSKLLLVVPSQLAYGDPAAQSGAPSGPLVFVVDIKEVK